LWGPADRATPDSSFYLDGARHLATGRGYATALAPLDHREPQPISMFAPGFSALMAPAIRAGASPRDSAAQVLAVSFVGYAAASYLLLIAAAGPRWWLAALLATGTLIFHPELLLALDNVLSDLPSAALATISVWLALLFARQREPRRGAAVGIGFVLGLPFLMRWASLCLLVPVAAGIFVSPPEPADWRVRLRRLGWLALGSLLAVAPWLLRNLVAAGNPMGPRRAELASPFTGATEALQALASGFVEARRGLGGGAVAAPAYTLAAFAALALFAVLFARGRAWRNPTVRLLCVAGAGYVVLMILVASLSSVDPLSRGRFWLPVWPIACASVLATLAGAERSGWTRRATAVVMLLALAFTAFGFQQRFRRELPRAGADQVYLAQPWRDSRATRRAVEISRECALVTNNPAALLIHNEVERVHRLPITWDDAMDLFRSRRPLCVVFYTRPGSAGANRGRKFQRDALNAARRNGRLKLREKDAVAELWVSP
jgi:hypothetical protein